MRVMMHVCCGPCAMWVAKRLIEGGGADLSAMFYNPNIHPVEEFEKRKEGALKFAGYYSIPISVYDDYMQDKWEGHENPGRCEMCYDMRLGFVARQAKISGYDAFTTSLLISPYQDHDTIKGLGEKYQSQYGIRFLYEDFRLYFREGQGLAREVGLYRQKYCGCIVSLSQKN